MSQYGFVHLPTLFVFGRPMPSLRAREAVGVFDLLAQDRNDEAVEFVAKLEGKTREESVLRLTAFTHEFRHFHDYLLTPHGNYLVRVAFEYAITNFAALTEITGGWSRDGRLEIDLPVNPSTLPFYGHRLIELRAGFQNAVGSSINLMEAAAMHVQIQQVATWLGRDVADSLLALLARMSPRYKETLGELWRAQAQLGIRGRDFRAIPLSLILLCLLDSDPMPIGSVLNQVENATGGLAGRRAAVLILNGLLKTVDTVVRRAMHASQEENLRFLNRLREVVPDPWRESIVEPFEDFMAASSGIQRRFLDDPMALLDPVRYIHGLHSDFIQPFMYMVSDKTNPSQTESTSWRGALSDPFTYVEEYKVTGRTIYELVCLPIPVSSSRLTLREDAWKNFADLFGGSLVIAEGADREHPVEGMWIRKMEQRWPVNFTNFGSRDSWLVAPVGLVS